MNWYWYVAREDELMCDLDGGTLLSLALRRLQKPELPIEVREYLVTESTSDDHFHLTVRLASAVPSLYRMVYQLYLYDHTYRSVKNLMRVLQRVEAPSLLISPTNWLKVRPVHGTFWRNPDAICQCELSIHKSQIKIQACPAHLKLRGQVNE